MSNSKPTINAEEVLTSFLRQRGMRKTPERFAILSMALTMQGHFEVDDLYKALDADAYHVSRATVYSTVELLCRCGLLRRLLIDSQKALYEVADGNHAHLICMQCGRVQEVTDSNLAESLTPRLLPGFSVSYVTAMAYGVCARCAQRNRRNARKEPPKTGTRTKKRP